MGYAFTSIFSFLSTDVGIRLRLVLTNLKKKKKQQNVFETFTLVVTEIQHIAPDKFVSKVKATS